MLSGCWSLEALEPEDVLLFQAGPLSLKPQLAISEIYNDNILYSQDPVSDFVTSLSPGLKVQVGRMEHNHIALTYTYDHLFYLENGFLDAGQHTVELGTRLQGKRLTLSGSDRIYLLSSPLGGVERVLATSNVDRFVNDHTYGLTYQISEKTEAYLRALYNATDYEEGISLYDIDTLMATAGFGYRAFAKTTFFGEMHYGLTGTEPNTPDLAENPDLTFVGGFLGARGNFTQKLSGTVKVGYESREFSDGSPAPSLPVVDASLVQRFSEKTALALSYARYNNVSVQFTRRPYTSDSFRVQFDQLLGENRKWQATVAGSYVMTEYESVRGIPAVSYDYIRGSINLAYRIQLWLTANIGYDYESVKSDSRGVIDYDVNRVTLRMAIGY
jgi:hypothetical protein